MLDSILLIQNMLFLVSAVILAISIFFLFYSALSTATIMTRAIKEKEKTN
jgi:F0F1-type ATP synthase assembly protein I